MKVANDIIKFIVEANRAGYANDKPIVKRLEDGGHKIIFARSGMKSVDYWWGGNPFSSQESITKSGKVIWAMQYRGWMEPGFENISSETFAFLRRALKLCNEKEPLRGPKEHDEGSFKYANSWGYNLDNFKGEERIWKDGEHIYTCRYFGGLVNL